MTVKQTGGIGFGGGRSMRTPSSVGTWRPTLDGFAVDFDRDAFTSMLSQKGYSVLWKKAAFCPNRAKADPHPKAHDINCTFCDGSGFVYYAETATQMLVQGVHLNESFYAYGRWDVGQVMVTALPEQALNYWDSIVLQNGIARFHEIVRRQPGTSSDTLKYEPLEILYVACKSRAGTLISYDVGCSVQITDGKLEWMISTGLPDDNEYYSVAYTYRPRYIVLDLLHQHRDSTVEGKHYEFPTQAVAKLDFLIRDESKDDAEVKDSDPFAFG